MDKNSVLSCLLLLLCVADSMAGKNVVIKKQGGTGQRAQFQCSSFSNTWSYTNNGGNNYEVGIFKSGDIMNIMPVVAKHEGVYQCRYKNDEVDIFNLVVMAVPKFKGCPPVKSCDLGTTITVPEGGPISLNISLDYVNGGPSDEKQDIEFARIKKGAKNLLSCSKAGCYKDARATYARSSSEPWDIKMNISNAGSSDSGVYYAEVDVDEGSNVYSAMTATFTVNVTPTPTKLPSPTTTSKATPTMSYSTIQATTTPSSCTCTCSCPAALN